MNRVLLLILVVFVIVSCNCPEQKTTNDKSNTGKVEVVFFGALKNMMHKGDISAKADLNDLKNRKHLYALGAIENLKGEIQIFNGESFNTFISDSTVLFDKSFNKKATLLVYAEVEHWKTLAIPSNIVTYAQLESFVATSAKSIGIDINKPFPFLVSGVLESFNWHVINWKDGDMEHSHEKHVKSGAHGTINDESVDLLGFYSNSHHAIFTHHTTNMHIHFKTTDNKLAGHVDDLVLSKDMELKLPFSTN